MGSHARTPSAMPLLESNDVVALQLVCAKAGTYSRRLHCACKGSERDREWLRQFGSDNNNNINNSKKFSWAAFARPIFLSFAHAMQEHL